MLYCSNSAVMHVSDVYISYALLNGISNSCYDWSYQIWTSGIPLVLDHLFLIHTFFYNSFYWIFKIIPVLSEAWMCSPTIRDIFLLYLVDHRATGLSIKYELFYEVAIQIRMECAMLKTLIIGYFSFLWIVAECSASDVTYSSCVVM